METVNSKEIRFPIQNLKAVQGLLLSLKSELTRFLESGINEDDILESALIGNQTVYEPGHEGTGHRRSNDKYYPKGRQVQASNYGV